MLAYYGISDSYDSVKAWYDGYRFGETEVYCPWDVICYCSKRIDNPRLFPRITGPTPAATKSSAGLSGRQEMD